MFIGFLSFVSRLKKDYANSLPDNELAKFFEMAFLKNF